MIKKIVGLLVLVLLQVTLVFGVKQTSDTAVINNWIREASALVYANPDSATLYLDSIYESSKELDYHYGLYKNHNLRAITYYMLGEYDRSVKEYIKALPYTSDAEPDQEVKIYNNIAYSLRNMGYNDSAMRYTIQASEYAQAHGLEDVYQRSLIDIAYIYMDQEDYISAIAYINAITENCEVSEDRMFIIRAYSTLALFYYRIGNFEKSHAYFHKAIAADKAYDGLDFLEVNYANLGLLYHHVARDYDTARYYYRKSDNLCYLADVPIKKLITNINIGNTFVDSYELDSAIFYYKKVNADTLLQQFPTYQAAVYTNMGMYHLRNGEYEKARTFLNEGLTLSIKYELLNYQKNAYGQLSTLDSIQGDYKQGYYNFVQFHLVSESLQLQETNKLMAISELDKFVAKEKYNNELLVKENENQNQHIIIQQVIIGVGLLFVLVLIVIILIVSKNRKKVKSLNTSLKNSNGSLAELNRDLVLQKKEMKELMMSKDRFVSILGHDLKNPFTGLLGLLELMETDWATIPEEQKREAIHHLHQSSIQTYQLLEDLLDWGKTQQGLIKVEITTFEALPLLNEVQNIYNLSLKKKEQTLIFDVEEKMTLTTDRKMLSQILQNLLGNAIKYSYVKGVITMAIHQKGAEVSICISDNGIGIPKDKIEGLFELDSTYYCLGTEGEVSTGMGLLLCKEYAKLIDCEIGVKSENREGSTFCLTLKKEDNQR